MKTLLIVILIFLNYSSSFSIIFRHDTDSTGYEKLANKLMKWRDQLKYKT